MYKYKYRNNTGSSKLDKENKRRGSAKKDKTTKNELRKKVVRKRSLKIRIVFEFFTRTKPQPPYINKIRVPKIKKII